MGREKTFPCTRTCAAVSSLNCDRSLFGLPQRFPSPHAANLAGQLNAGHHPTLNPKPSGPKPLNPQAWRPIPQPLSKIPASGQIQPEAKASLPYRGLSLGSNSVRL